MKTININDIPVTNTDGAPPPAPPAKFHLVFAHHTAPSFGVKKLSQIFYELDENGKPKTEKPYSYIFKRGALAGFRSGAIYAFTGTPDSVRYQKGMMAVVYLQDSETVARWSTTDRANRAAFEAEERLSAEGARRPYKENLEPVRLAYRAAPMAVKAQMLADFVAYITR